MEKVTTTPTNRQPAKKPTFRDKANQEIDRLLALFESGQIPEAVAKTVIPPLDVPCARWSLANRMLTMLAGTADARGYRQWQEAGRHVRKGARAFYILAPRIAKVRVEDPETGETVREKRLVGFLAVPVFRAEDTDGQPLEYPPMEPPEPPPLAELAHSWGLKVSYVPFAGGWYGHYRPERDEIVLASHEESTFFHELAHAAHKRAKGELRPGQDWKQEVVAELMAAVLMRLFGRKNHDGNAYQYIRSYAERANKNIRRACMAVLVDVGRCLDLILGQEATAQAA